MGRPRKPTDEVFYDIFSAFPLTEQKIIVRTLDRLVKEREKDEIRASRLGEKREGEA